MNSSQLELKLIPAANDLPLHSAKYQRQRREFAESLESSGLKISVTIELIEAAGGGTPTTYLGDFVIQLIHSPGLGLVGAALGAWLHARYGRKVRLRIGEIEAEAQTVAEVEKLLKRVEEFQQRNEPKAAREP